MDTAGNQRTVFIKSVTSSTVLQFFKEEIKLVEQSFEDYCYLLHKEGKWEPSKSGWVAFFDNCGIIALGKCDGFTCTTANLHLYIRPQYQNKPISIEIGKLGLDWIKQTIPSALKVILESPKVCRHVHRYARALGFEAEATLKHAILWKGKLEDLIIFSRMMI